jgi:hypothetical protein
MENLSKGEKEERRLLMIQHRVVCPEFRIWKNIYIGVKTPTQIHQDFQDPKVRAYGIDMKDLKVSSAKRRLSLVIVRGTQLGMTSHERGLEKAFKQAVKIGLRLCPAEVGPLLRLRWRYQPRFNFLHIGMEPINGRIFYLECSDKRRWINTFNTVAYEGYQGLVFCIDK